MLWSERSLTHFRLRKCNCQRELAVRSGIDTYTELFCSHVFWFGSLTRTGIDTCSLCVKYTIPSCSLTRTGIDTKADFNIHSLLFRFLNPYGDWYKTYPFQLCKIFESFLNPYGDWYIIPFMVVPPYNKICSLTRTGIDTSWLLCTRFLSWVP